MSQTSMAEPVRELLLALGFSLREAEESSPVPRSTYFYNLPYLQGPDSFQQAWRLGDPDRPLFAEIRMGMWRKQDVGHLLLGRRWETRTALHEIGVACEYQKALGTA
ncbi:MAG: hypothetical protein HY542_02505, partial [Deltaproteobacteria bacterium]|nr:hypothetical protein [Deltaproteobacteria bacterium]